jgi:hypothetical protein
VDGGSAESIADCSTIAAPTSCGPYADECAMAGADAIATNVVGSGFSVTDGWIHWVRHLDYGSSCNGIYRTPKAGGHAERIAGTDDAVAVQADESGLYWIESKTAGTSVVHVWSEGTDHVLRAIDMRNDRRDAGLVATSGGVIVVDETTIFRATFTGLVDLAPVPPQLASGIAWNGAQLFGARRLPTNALPSGELVRIQGSELSSLAPRASTHNTRTVVADGNDVFFVADGTLKGHTELSKIAVSGGPVVVLAEEEDDAPFDSLAVDADNVYFVVGSRLKRVPRSGGPVTVIADCGGTRDGFLRIDELHVDAKNVYLRLGPARGGDAWTPEMSTFTIAAIPK